MTIKKASIKHYWHKGATLKKQIKKISIGVDEANSMLLFLCPVNAIMVSNQTSWELTIYINIAHLMQLRITVVAYFHTTKVLRCLRLMK